MRMKLDDRVYDLELASDLDDTDKRIVLEIFKNLERTEDRFFTLTEIPVECEPLSEFEDEDLDDD